MIKKILTAILGGLMIVFTILAATSAMAYPAEDYDYYGNPGYYYYGEFNEYDDFNSIPTVVGPYPRYYLSHYQDGTRSYFLHDDFNHFDTYDGYRDLDVYTPYGVDVLRNPAGTLEAVDPDYHLTYRQQEGGYHVYGVLPGGSMYKKHYYHEHPFELEEFGYDYFTPARSYAVRPVYTNPCMTSRCH